MNFNFHLKLNSPLVNQFILSLFILLPFQLTPGIHSDKGETVARTFTAGQKFGVAAVNNDFAESVYISNKREPLGKGYSRGHELPAVTKEESFPGFGMKSKDVADGKLVVFPRGVQPDTEEMRKQYLKSHGELLLVLDLVQDLKK